MKRITRCLLPLVVVALAGACTTTTPWGESASAGQRSCCTSNLAPAATFTDNSLYQLDSTWTNDSGRSLKLGQLQGRVQVVAMFFASCTYACPIIVHDMNRIEAALPETVRARVGFTLITIDPGRDTPEALHAYRGVHQLPADRWTFLQSGPDNTLELAALLGVKFKREASGQFAHSNLITILNQQGEIIHQLAGLNQDISETARRIAGAVASE
jgi:protein SCO1/2